MSLKYFINYMLNTDRAIRKFDRRQYRALAFAIREMEWAVDTLRQSITVRVELNKPIYGCIQIMDDVTNKSEKGKRVDSLRCPYFVRGSMNANCTYCEKGDARQKYEKAFNELKSLRKKYSTYWRDKFIQAYCK